MRRRRGLRSSSPPSLFGGLFDKVEEKIKGKIIDEVAQFHPWTLTSQDIIQHAIDPEVADVLRKAKTYKVTQYDPSMGNFDYNHRTKISLEFDHMLVPQRQYFNFSFTLRQPIDQWIKPMTEIYNKWMTVLHVAKWFDEHASMGAVRYYWPCMMSLLPKDSGKLQELHMAGIGGHKEPPGIANLLPLCRDMASVVVSGQLLPERDLTAGKSCKVTVTVSAHEFTVRDYTERGHTVQGQEISFNF